MRDTGKPTISVNVVPGTPVETAENRETLRTVCEQICSEAAGHPVKVTLEQQGLDEVKSS